ncbi:glycosyltransferase family 4 protein [Vibrio sp. Vb1018]|uniref:glycosyltransferase family 4 protein n=1 Tax=Vibrio sp. Vb1018 TaxID=3074636 RepID=UPI002964210B|nr:glycosyltransferase family 4 protein [Vibrio sp. Vb1018]MDW1821126.1 glycosyltransferase family 4 protein [Vibrio sp. Vb1018]
MNAPSYKICIWMNIPSHHQSGFFRSLEEHDNISIEVRYFQERSKNRTAEGWNSEYIYKNYEKCVNKQITPEQMLATVPDARERIHIISSSFSPELVRYFCNNSIQWIHWSEMPGIRLAELLNFRMPVFRFLYPLMLLMKRKEGSRISRHAIGAFSQGKLARFAFTLMGVKHKKIFDLYYVPEPLPNLTPALSIKEFAQGRRVLLCVSALCRRKGIDILLKSFTNVANRDWCLVLCGLDKANGQYQRLANSLGIGDKVLFTGAYPIDSIAEVYKASDVFVLPSRFDGWGAVLNEAASIGLPIIGTDLSGAALHIIKNDFNGYCVKAGSVRSLSKALLNYVEHPKLIEVHGNNSKLHFSKEFTPKENVQRLIIGIDNMKGVKN